jgi:hypothetical protein
MKMRPKTIEQQIVDIKGTRIILFSLFDITVLLGILMGILMIKDGQIFFGFVISGIAIFTLIFLLWIQNGTRPNYEKMLQEAREIDNKLNSKNQVMLKGTEE